MLGVRPYGMTLPLNHRRSAASCSTTSLAIGDMRHTVLNNPEQATAAALCSFSSLRESLLSGFVAAKLPAAVPDLCRWTVRAMRAGIFIALMLCATARANPRALALPAADRFFREVPAWT